MSHDFKILDFFDIRHDYSDCRIVSSEEGLRVEKRYERLIKIFSDKETELFTEWAATVPETVHVGLNRNILSREPDSTTLILNFDPELLGVLKEVNYLKQMSRSDIPEDAMKVPLLMSRALIIRVQFSQNRSR